ncbi:UNVERIFIED_CONTAM: hypothetical protein PYX00_004443 [Menopon gallinae]|uniref:Growth factor receptor-bound protein 14 n=1 Tax=Menopon gallinae TaxID=328185 RepID=A0AAW2I470_9NEOP
MKCSCMESNTSYERLPNVPTDLELTSMFARDSEDKDTSTEKQQELVFYNDDNSYQTVVVEKNLCVSDLCQLLALKNRVAKDVNWTIIEHWIELGLERSLEDHEDVLSTYHNMESFAKSTAKRFVFRKDFIKYEFFHNPQQFFPVNMIDLGEADDLPISVTKSAALHTILSSEECPTVFSHVWIREANKQVWVKAFLLLKDKKLYLSYKVQVIAKLLRSCRSNNSSGNSSPNSSLSSSPNNKRSFILQIINESDRESGQPELFADLSNYHVYTTLNAKNQLRAPTEFGICLRPTNLPMSSEQPYKELLARLKCLACESGRARLCWITAMRLAKYGKQLRENYRSFKNKQLENKNSKEYNSFLVPNESVRSRVAMDFTGSVGRIVEDPQEAKAIALAEGYCWKKRWRPIIRHPTGKIIQIQGIEAGIHVTQPWFHSGMTREQAANLVAKHGTVDGVFLVRDSHSTPGAFVLTLKYGNKVLHKEISPLADPQRDTVCYTLDNGITKFYDLLQLIEFYQLNMGSLPTRLTHYLVQSPTGVLYKEKSMTRDAPASF